MRIKTSPSPTTVSISSRTFTVAGCTGPLKVNTLRPPSCRTRRADRRRRRSSLVVSSRQSSCRRRPCRGVAPMERTAARAASALSNGSLTSCSSVADMTVYLTMRLLRHAHAERTTEQRGCSDVLAENQHFKRAAEAAGHEQRFQRQTRFQVGGIDFSGLEPEQKVRLIEKPESGRALDLRR